MANKTKTITGIIYKATAPSGRAYVGQTIKPFNKRISQHKNGGCRALKAAIDKYGDEIVWSVLKEVHGVDKKKVIARLNKLEVKYIDELGTLVPNGYNLRTGGDSHTPSRETRNRMSEAKIGKKYSEEARRNMREARAGIVFSAEHKENMRKAHKGKNVGKNNHGARAVECSKDGKKWRRFDCAADAEREGLAKRSCISRVCSGKGFKGYSVKYHTRKTAGGYRWRYAI